MELQVIDWAIILIYILFSLGIGIFFTKRAGASTEEYFLSGRSLPWWIVGTSMVATTFAADTPLAITEFVRQDGIWKNWFWWNILLSGLLATFLFSRLWRRAKVLTDNELLELRYTGKPAAFLRMFKAGYFALLYNFIVMGWVINAMASVAAVMLNIDRWTAVWGCVLIALLYALLSGFWGVVITDFVQFGIAMAGSIILAIVAVNSVGGMDTVLAKINAMSAAGTISDGTLKFIPPLPDANIVTRSFWESPFSKFMIFLTVMWWSHHNTDGGGYIIQRMSAAKDERHALLATLWFNLSNYAFRVWPWVVVALVSIVAFPDVSGWELGDKVGYPLVMQKFLGPGLRGLLVVSFLAAFMSTIDTHLNWGASYLINDVYKRFIRKNDSFTNPDQAQKHYVLVSRIITVFLMLFAALVAIKMQSISRAWEFIFAMGAGIGLVLILRWFWWRINAWTEISALLTSLTLTVMLEVIAAYQTLQAGETYTLFGKAPVLFGLPLQIHHKLLIIVPISVLTWLIVTKLTRPEPKEVLMAFYERVQPGGWWEPVIGDFTATKKPVSKGFVQNWLAGILMIYGATFSIGQFVFGHTGYGITLALVAAAGFFWVWKFTLNPEKKAA
jgi:Na+/proline symporter